MAEEESGPYPEYGNLSAADLARHMKDVRAELDDADAIKKKHQKRFDFLRLQAIPTAMDDEGLTNFNLDGIGRIGLTSDIYAGIVSGQKANAYKWLEDNQHGDLIQPTVNASSLKAAIKQILKKGEETLPEELFKVTPFSRASITKTK